MLSSRSFTLTKRKSRSRHFSAKANGILGFSEVNETSGYCWLKKFMKGNPEQVIKKPEALRTPKAAVMNREVVEGVFFYDLQFTTNIPLKL